MRRTLIVTGAALLTMIVVGAMPGSSAPGKKQAASAKPLVATPLSDKAPATLEEARMYAEMMDDASQALIHTIHDWYPNKAGQPVAAATTVREVIDAMNAKGWPQTRFLGVTGILMNPDHRPQDTFERKAQAAIRQGKSEFVAREGAEFRVARVVPLRGGCFSCHWSDGSAGSRAAITFRFPLGSKAAAAAFK